MVLFVIALILSLSGFVNSHYYDSFTGKLISEEDVELHVKLNNTLFCVNDIVPCVPSEGRRIDGSCNNLKFPSRGASHTPFYRLLDAVYSEGFEPRNAKSGSPLPACRKIRTTVLGDGTLPDQKFTQLLLHFLVFFGTDMTNIQDSVNYVQVTTYCCTDKGKYDKMCVPSPVPEDDPFFRFSDVRCLNLTRPISFQSLGCLKNDTTPQRSNPATPTIDLSNIYGVTLNETLEKGRSMKDGMLKQEIEEGRVWPPSSTSQDNVCQNLKPYETRCHDTPDVSLNALLGINLVAIWFWRQHNSIASKLAKINPCWCDDKIFYTARDINIAIEQQILYYEAFPTLLGYQRMTSDGVLAKSKGFRDLYQPSLYPQLSLESTYVLRWVHLLQDGRVKMFDPEGHYLKQFPIVNMTRRTGFLAVDSNIDYITQGSFRQACAKLDYLVDPEIAENGFGPLQKATDITTSDLCKGRYFGLQPYVRYRNYCTGKNYSRFEDLTDIIDPERVELLKDLYQSVEDVDLMAGIWLERPITGGSVPPTLYCILTQFMKQNLMSDRHWFERPNRPNAFTTGQLKQIRKATMACMLCEVGDKITEVTQKPFERISSDNPQVKCSQIPRLDFSAWKDKSCSY